MLGLLGFIAREKTRQSVARFGLVEATSTSSPPPCVGAVARFPALGRTGAARAACFYGPAFQEIEYAWDALAMSGLGQLEELSRLLEDGLVVQRAACTRDVQQGWRVFEIA